MNLYESSQCCNALNCKGLSFYQASLWGDNTNRPLTSSGAFVHVQDSKRGNVEALQTSRWNYKAVRLFEDHGTREAENLRISIAADPRLWHFTVRIHLWKMSEPWINNQVTHLQNVHRFSGNHSKGQIEARKAEWRGMVVGEGEETTVADKRAAIPDDGLILI